MPAVFHVFKEFANDFHDVKYFAIDIRFRFVCRFFQFTLPIGIWIILITQGKDLAAYTAAHLAPLFGALWALSILGGPLAAIFLYGLHSVPLQEPLPSSILLAVEFAVDVFFFLMWLISTIITAVVLQSNDLQCPYIWHPQTNYYGEEPVPLGNATLVNIFIGRNQTHSQASAQRNQSFATSTSQISPSIKAYQTSIINSTIQATSAIHTQIIVQSETCYPIHQNLIILLSIVTALYFLNGIIDIHSYLKGVYWDYQDFTDRSRVETMATLRRIENYGIGGIGVGKGEFARSRTASRVGASANRSRAPSVSSRFGAASSLNNSMGSAMNLNGDGPSSRVASAQGSRAQGLNQYAGVVAGKLQGTGLARSGSNLALDGSGGNLKRTDSLSNVRGPATSGLAKVMELGGGLGPLKDFSKSGMKSSPKAPRSRAGSVSSLMKKSGK
ncbi:hypothetical protein HDU81_009705 [Chytriomyces hyalinus]|nr:hypothetical protein HDU81_009705 [Chytriomyces hyalinus]